MKRISQSYRKVGGGGGVGDLRPDQFLDHMTVIKKLSFPIFYVSHLSLDMFNSCDTAVLITVRDWDDI